MTTIEGRRGATAEGAVPDFLRIKPLHTKDGTIRSAGVWTGVPLGAATASAASGRVSRAIIICAGTSAPSPANKRRWHTPFINSEEETMPRVAPITSKDDVPTEYHALVDDVLGVFGQIRGPFSMLLHSPKLAERMLQFVKFNRGVTVVEPPLLSHAILASVRERDAHYVWAAQVGTARRAGVPEATIDILRANGDPASLGEDECDIVNYTRQLVRTNRVDQALFDRLQKRHGTQWLVELTAAAGYFGMLAGIVNAFEVAAPPDGDKLPA
jgi:4-carboxymuconolactone decarboxylase